MSVHEQELIEPVVVQRHNVALGFQNVSVNCFDKPEHLVFELVMGETILKSEILNQLYQRQRIDLIERLLRLLESVACHS